MLGGMTEDEFRSAVLGRLDQIDGRLDGMERRLGDVGGRLEVLANEMAVGLEKANVRMNAILARIEEQDNAIDNISLKMNGLQGDVQRLHDKVHEVGLTGQRALDGVTGLARRVLRIEHPESGGPSTDAA